MNLKIEINARDVRAEKIGGLDKQAQDCQIPDSFYLREKQIPILFKLLLLEDSVSSDQDNC